MTDPIEGLRRQSREYRSHIEAIQNEDPQLWANLRENHNAVLRQWSYRGTTAVPRQNRRGSSMRMISRSSSHAVELPPLFRQSPDLRKTNTSSTSRTLKWMLAVLSPQNDTDECSDETPSDRKLDGCLDFARIVERMTLNRLYPGNNPQEAFTESCPSRESETAHEQHLDSHTGLIFCEEMLRHCHGEAGFEDAYRAMDLDSDGSVSVNELVTAVRKLTLSLRLPELVRVHQHLEKCENLSIDLSPTHFSERTKTLTAKYRKAGKLTKYCIDMERISAAEKYFISRSLKIKS